MFKPIIVPHGITDLIDAPIQSLVVYGTVTPLVYFLPSPVKASLLVAGSMYHMRHDIPGGPVAIALMHLLWINHPWVAHTYLTCIHVPRHYYRSLDLHFKQKKMAILLMTIVTLADGVCKWTKAWKELWWVGPVLAHVIMTEWL
jgi:hypothetical protein